MEKREWKEIKGQILLPFSKERVKCRETFFIEFMFEEEKGNVCRCVLWEQRLTDELEKVLEVGRIFTFRGFIDQRGSFRIWEAFYARNPLTQKPERARAKAKAPMYHPSLCIEHDGKLMLKIEYAMEVLGPAVVSGVIREKRQVVPYESLLEELVTQAQSKMESIKEDTLDDWF